MSHQVWLSTSQEGGNKLEQKHSSESNFFAQLLYVLSWEDARKDGQIQKLGP